LKAKPANKSDFTDWLVKKIDRHVRGQKMATTASPTHRLLVDNHGGAAADYRAGDESDEIV
jgi:hypothetical protein